MPVLLVTGMVFGGRGVDAAIAEAPMKAQRRLGRALSWPWITSAFLTDVAVLMLAIHLPIPVADRRVVGGCRRRGGADDRLQAPQRHRHRTPITDIRSPRYRGSVCKGRKVMVTDEPDRGSAPATPLNVSYRVDRISKYLSGHWLDFGCADGGYDEEMLARGLEAVTGVDVEESRIAEAKRRNLPNAQYTKFDGNWSGAKRPVLLM